MHPVPSVDKPKAINVLRSNAILKLLSEADLERLASSCRVVRAEKGEVLWFKGADVDFMGLAADGWVKMVRTSSIGNDTTIELFGPGHLFGLMGAITGTGCPLTACAIHDLWYVRIPKQMMLELYGQSIVMKDYLIRKAAVRLHGAVELMARLSSGTVEQRIAAILFILVESYAVKEPDGILLQCPLTRQEISEMAGTTVESTIRAMSRWQKEGIISTERQQILITDEARLARILND